MAIYNDVLSTWNSNKNAFETKMLKWADTLNKNENAIREARLKFRSWKPFRIYLSYTNASNKRFSLRFLGQEIATIKTEKNGMPNLEINAATAANNSKYFPGCPNPCLLTKGLCAWKDKEARLFRDYFRDLSRNGDGVKTGVGEHRLESWIISEMQKTSRGKFSGTLSGVQPITLHGCPFQMPLPINGSKGRPGGNANGNIDILARRRGLDHKVRLSVWELKDIGKLDHVVKQVTIYAVTLLLALRSPVCGDAWWKLFGFKRKIPESLEIEAVMAVSNKAEFLRQWAQVRNELPLGPIGRDSIKFFAAYYDMSRKTVDLQQLSENLP